MGVGPALLGGIMQRSDDIGMIKQQQDSRPAVEQQNVQTQMVKKADEMRHQVLNPENSNKTDTHADAREKGKNEYFYRKKTGNKKTSEQLEGKVVKKCAGGGFDVKV